MIETLKIIMTVLNTLYLVLIFLFCRGLSWENKRDRASIIGFSLMMGVYALNIIVCWI